MVRVLVGGLQAAGAGVGGERQGDPTVPVARRLRDTGHEVVLLGADVSPDRLATTAVQEDVAVVALVGADGEGAGRLIDLLASYDAGDVVVFDPE